MKTHLITNNTKCDIYQCHFFVHFIYIYAQMEPLINKNKHFLTFTPSQQITKYTWSHKHIFIYTGVDTVKYSGVHVNTFFFNSSFMQSLMIILAKILFNFKQNWNKPMHKDGFFFKISCFNAKFYDHLGKHLLLVIVYVFNFKQNWIKSMHKDGVFFW